MALFITFEGPDGSGKSTQAALLAGALRDRGLAVRETREPGGTPLGEEIRRLALGSGSPDATPLALTFLLSASRAQLVEAVVRPALEAGQTVVADRFADSTAAYQSFGLGVPLSDVQEVTRIATGDLRPDVTIYVDIEPEVGLERTRARGHGNRLDDETVEFHRRVREGYLALIAQEPERWICVNGDAAPDLVHDAILRQLEPLLEAGERP